MKKIIYLLTAVAVLTSCGTPSAKSTDWKKELVGHDFKLSIDLHALSDMEDEEVFMLTSLLSNATATFTETSMLDPFGEEHDITYTKTGYKVEDGFEIKLKKVSDTKYLFTDLDSLQTEMGIVGFEKVQ